MSLSFHAQHVALQFPPPYLNFSTEKCYSGRVESALPIARLLPIVSGLNHLADILKAPWILH